MSSNTVESRSEQDMNMEKCSKSSNPPMTSTAESTPSSTDYAPSTMLKGLRKELQENIRMEMKVQMGPLKKLVDETCDMMINGNIPVLECRSREIATLKRDLEVEREGRMEDTKNFLQCVEKLMEEIVQANLKIVKLEGLVEGTVPPKPFQLPSVTSLDHGSEPWKDRASSAASFLVNSQRGPKMDDGASLSPQTPTDTPPESPLDNFFEDSAANSSHSNDPGQSQAEDSVSNAEVTSGSRDNVNTSADPPQSSDNDDENLEMESIHEKADATGRYLPFLCLCGLEFDTEVSLSGHVRETTRVEYASASASDAPEPSGNGVESQMPLLLPYFDFNAANFSSLQEIEQTPLTCSSNSTSTSSSLTGGASTGMRHEKDPSKPLFCLCGEKYTSPVSLHMHVRTHNLRTLLPCRFCSRRFASNSQLQTHLLQEHKSKRSPGRPCKPVKTDQHGLERQYVDTDGTVRYLCKCGRRYWSKAALHLHARNSSSTTLFKCCLCSESEARQYTALLSLKTHMRAVHSVEYFKGKNVCSSCAQVFDNMVELRRHRFTIHKD